MVSVRERACPERERERERERGGGEEATSVMRAITYFRDFA